jgi:hypothetical protein
MVYRVMPIVTHAVAVVLVVASVALANPMDKTLSEEHFEGTVIRVDAKGGATIRTTEGREFTVQATGLQVGDKIECGRHRDGMCEKVKEKTT